MNRLERSLFYTHRFVSARASAALLSCFLIACSSNAAVQVGLYTNNDSATLRSTAQSIVSSQGDTLSYLPDLSTSSLAGLDVLWALNESNGQQLPGLNTYSSQISDFVSSGGVFLYHDRRVTGASSVLPGGNSFDIHREYNDTTARDINVLNPLTLVTNGPGGVITNSTLDGGTASTHGYAVSGTLPGRSLQVLSRGNPLEVVDFTYQYGAGDVHYSSIPLDYYLDRSDTDNRRNFTSIYAPNVAAYVSSLAERAPKPPQPKLHVLTIGVDYGPGFARSLNGKADAEAIWNKLKAFDAWADSNPEPIILDPDAEQPVNFWKVEAAIKAMRKHVNPGDDFVFYFSGHGTFKTSGTGDETSVPVTIYPYDILNTHDEELVLNRSGIDKLTDDKLADFFKDDEKWDQVDKLFLLDACHSGGFWGDNKTEDTGDLEGLKKAGLLASSPEWGVSFIQPFTGRSFWSLALEEALSSDIKEIEEVAQALGEYDWEEYVGLDLPVKFLDFAPEDELTLPFEWEPYFVQSADLDFDSLAVPEPISLALLAMCGLVVASRRRSVSD